MSLNGTIERRKRRWRDFFDRSSSPRHMFLIRYSDTEIGPRPWPHPDKVRERIEWSWRQYQAQRARAEWLDDDSVPFLDVFTGTEIFAQAFGCDVHRPDDNMPSARSLITEPCQVAGLRAPDLDTPCLAVLFAMADELRRRAGADALVRLPDIQSPIDIAALIWDKSHFYVGMIQAPEAVKELADKTRALLVTFTDAWYARYGTEFMSHHPDYYMPRGFTLSEDEVGAVSADMFAEFFLPHLAALSERYGGLGIHCCARSRHQWENFARIPHLRLLQLNQPVEVLRDAYTYFAPHCAQMHGWYGEEGETEAWLAALPAGSRVVLQVNAKTRDEALALSETYRAACA